MRRPKPLMEPRSQYAYSYDPVGRLYEVRKDGIVISSYTYDGNGNRLSFTDGVTTLTGIYDSQDRLLQYGNVAYTYSANGELLSKTISGQTTNYQYDVLGISYPSLSLIIQEFNTTWMEWTVVSAKR